MSLPNTMGKYVGTTTYSMNDRDFDRWSGMQLQLMKLFEAPDGDVRITVHAQTLDSLRPKRIRFGDGEAD